MVGGACRASWSTPVWCVGLKGSGVDVIGQTSDLATVIVQTLALIWYVAVCVVVEAGRALGSASVWRVGCEGSSAEVVGQSSECFLIACRFVL